MTWVLIVLAVARVTRLITSDVLFQGTRGTVLRAILRGNPEGAVRLKIAYLMTCDWCASVYVGAAGAGAWWLWGDTMAFMAVTGALAASYVTGFLATVTERGE